MFFVFSLASHFILFNCNTDLKKSICKHLVSNNTKEWLENIIKFETSNWDDYQN